MSVESLIAATKSAVKVLGGESFETYDVSNTSIHFGFRTWDIPKEFEDQDEEETDRVIEKFRRKILLGIDDPNVKVDLWPGDKNYLEGELTITTPANQT
jgi:hypothetical protein